jgi:hypothetical protein
LYFAAKLNAGEEKGMDHNEEYPLARRDGPSKEEIEHQIREVMNLGPDFEVHLQLPPEVWFPHFGIEIRNKKVTWEELQKNTAGKNWGLVRKHMESRFPGFRLSGGPLCRDDLACLGRPGVSLQFLFAPDKLKDTREFESGLQIEPPKKDWIPRWARRLLGRE